MAVVARTSGDVTATTRAIQRLIREMDPTLPTFGVRSMRATVDASMALLSFTMIVLGVAAAVTLVLGMIGLYGVIAYVVALRTRELGVRIALGAQPSAVATMVTTQGLALCGDRCRLRPGTRGHRWPLRCAICCSRWRRPIRSR